MGERLGRIESLVQHGITPITPDQGVRTLCELLRHPLPGVALVVTGRFGEPPTLKLAGAELPLQRFLERKQVHYPGVELVVDAELSVRTDPYLEDHIVQKQRMFPAVLGLEAMAQVAMALAGAADAPVFENVEFLRPIAVPDKTPLTIRLAALQREAGWVEVCLRSEETEFQADHFRALCRFGAVDGAEAPPLALSPFESPGLPLNPQNDLYNRILFHRGRFCRLRSYRLLKAKECVAEITSDGEAPWFGPYLPGELVLGDPGARDAALHAIQACIPHRRLLPTAIERLVIRRLEPGPRVVRAKERARDGDNFVYDLEVMNAGGSVLERWEGLRLHAVEMMAPPGPWPESLLAPYLERRLEELEAEAPVNVVFGRDGGQARSEDSARLIQQALGQESSLWRRPDGKPVVFGGRGISAAHSQHFTLAIAGGGGVACDLEELTPRAEAVWRDLLGEEGLKLAGAIAQEQAEDLNTAATRVWTARECVKKAGLAVEPPLVFEPATADGWVLLRAGSLTVATWVATVRGMNHALVAAVAFHAPLARGQPAALAGARR
jgi:enediyne polyketide synthase